MLDVDFLLTSDFAEVIGGKLYLQGGGWDRVLHRGPFPFQRNIGISTGITVPWEDTNQQYRFEMEVRNEDTSEQLVQAQGALETGRPAGISPGKEQLVSIAFNGVVKFEQPGSYVILVSINGEQRKRKAFSVEALPPS